VSTDYQTARTALGARLRELRTEAGMQGKQLAALLGWQPSKVSRLELGRQTPTVDDLGAWAAAVGKPAVAEELVSRLRGLESHYRSWRRQLATGHRARQDLAASQTQRTRVLRGLEVDVIPGLFQTADYARHVFLRNAELQDTPRDTDDAVRARIRHQESLYAPGRRFRFLVWEPAMHVRICPVPVLDAQLERLSGLSGLDTVDLGIIPLGAPLRITPAHGFWIYDERQVIVEMINAELWLDDPQNVALYLKTWEWLDASAVRGRQAQRLIARARQGLRA
jgi:transcriptional regulator with XRE-family HTH domain